MNSFENVSNISGEPYASKVEAGARNLTEYQENIMDLVYGRLQDLDQTERLDAVLDYCDLKQRHGEELAKLTQGTESFSLVISDALIAEALDSMPRLKTESGNPDQQQAA